MPARCRGPWARLALGSGCVGAVARVRRFRPELFFYNSRSSRRRLFDHFCSISPFQVFCAVKTSSQLHTVDTRSALSLSHPTLHMTKHSQARGESAKLPNSVGHTRHARRHILAHLSTQTTYSQSLSTLRFSCVIAFMAINLPVEIAFMAINLPVEIQHSHRRLTAAGRAVVNRTAHFKSLSLRLPA